MSDGAPQVSCLIAATPRSGGWLLADLLDRTGLVGRPEEYFRPEMRQLWFDEWRLGEAPGHDVHVAKAVASGTGPNGVFSVKLHWHHLTWLLGALRSLPDGAVALSDADLLARWLPNPRYVQIRRDDPGRQAVSYYRAIHSGEWFAFEGEQEKGGVLGAAIDPSSEFPGPDLWQIRWLEELIVEQQRQWTAYFEESRIRPLDVDYEELVSKPAETVRRVLDFLEVAPPPGFVVSKSALIKQSDHLSAAWLDCYLEHRDSLGSGLRPWPEASNEPGRQPGSAAGPWVAPS
jgi:LPS sulfotransferase NodH